MPQVPRRRPRRDAITIKQEQRSAAKCAIDSTNMSREAALAFLEADENGDGVLSFDEFMDCMSRLQAKTGASVSSQEVEQLRNLFDSIDCDKSGTIEMNEYFLFALDVASANGCGIGTMFKKYDKSGEGQLDAEEFAAAVEDLGFSTSFAHDLFVDMDEGTRVRRDPYGIMRAAC